MSNVSDRVEIMLLDLGFSRIDIKPVRGYWAQNQQDCMRWTGWAMKDGRRVSIGSWQNLSDCAKYGITATPGREAGGYADWDIQSKNPRVAGKRRASNRVSSVSTVRGAWVRIR